MSLSYARDEINWLLHHTDMLPKNKQKFGDDLIDRHLPEMIFYMEEIRGRVRLQMVLTFLMLLMKNVMQSLQYKKDQSKNYQNYLYFSL